MSALPISETDSQEIDLPAAAGPQVAAAGVAIAEAPKRLFGRPFVKKPLPPEARLAEVRGKVEAGEASLAVAAAMLERSTGWLRDFSVKQGWVVPIRPGGRPRGPAKRASTRKKPLRRPRRLTPAVRARSLARASQASWRAIDALTAGLEIMIAENAGADAIAKQTTAINKLVTDLRRNGLHDGDKHWTGDANEHAGIAPAETADLAADMAGARARLVERFCRALELAGGAENSADGERARPLAD